MKAILMSIRPEWVVKILNGEKTIEIRKKFPKDYVGWVYIYCTKEGYLSENSIDTYNKYFAIRHKPRFTPNYMRGKVISKFWCDNVEEIKLNLAMRFFTKSMNEEELLKQSCLTSKELENYLWSNICCGYAIHITNLEIFDKPKEISEFRQYTGFNFNCSQVCKGYKKHETRCLDPYNYCPYLGKKLTRAPQSWQFIEV